MTNSSRRSEIIKILQESKTPQSGTALGEALGVSRQIIVQDIALLRTSGYDILSTNRGYILNESNTNPRRLVKVRHGSDRIEEELNLVVDLGGCVEDVLVNHRTYAKIEAPLNVKNRRDVQNSWSILMMVFQVRCWPLLMVITFITLVLNRKRCLMKL